MPPNNLIEMNLGFAVILGILGFYILALIIRTHTIKKKYPQKNHDQPGGH